MTISRDLIPDILDYLRLGDILGLEIVPEWYLKKRTRKDIRRLLEIQEICIKFYDCFNWITPYGLDFLPHKQVKILKKSCINYIAFNLKTLSYEELPGVSYIIMKNNVKHREFGSLDFYEKHTRGMISLNIKNHTEKQFIQNLYSGTIAEYSNILTKNDLYKFCTLWNIVYTTRSLVIETIIYLQKHF